MSNVVSALYSETDMELIDNLMKYVYKVSLFGLCVLLAFLKLNVDLPGTL